MMEITVGPSADDRHLELLMPAETHPHGEPVTGRITGDLVVTADPEVVA